MITPIDKFIKTQGGEMFSRTWEQPSSLAPIILLHDSLGSVDLWGSFPLSLSEITGRTVIAYDRLGFGRSSTRAGLPSIAFIAEEAEIYFPSLKKELGISQFCLFGHSVGGGMAVEIAARFPNECLAVVTESAQAFVEDITIQGIKAGKETFSDPKMFAKIEKLHGEKTQWVLDAWTEVWLSPEFARWSLEKTLPKVQCPLLALHGDRDEYGSSRFPEMLSRLAGGKSSMEILKNCGHVPHREQKEAVLNLVESFLVNNSIA